MADIQLKKMNLDFLILDFSKATTEPTTEETLEFGIHSTSPLATGQYDEISDTPFVFPKQISRADLSPISPEEASEGPLGLLTRFTCNVCSKCYRGNMQLRRHMKKHSSPDKFSCSVVGCLKTMYRTDTMRRHINSHEKRLKTEMERRSDEIADTPFVFPKQISRADSSPISPEEVSERPLALNNRFTCNVCSNQCRGKLELTRHMKKHNSPNRFPCSIAGCLQTFYRMDAMRCHIKAHEKRLKAEMERRRGM
jgi:uncharacterized Zn-finger protein